MSEKDEQDLQHKIPGAEVHHGANGEAWYEVTLVPPQGGPTAPPAVLGALGDVDYQVDEFEGVCAGCGEQPHDQHPPFGPHPVDLIDPAWVREPPDVDVDELEAPAQCQFGNTGSRVESCDRDAIEGTDRCGVHI